MSIADRFQGASLLALAATEAIYPANLVLAHRGWSQVLDATIAQVIDTGEPMRARIVVSCGGGEVFTMEATVVRVDAGVAVIFDPPT